MSRSPIRAPTRRVLKRLQLHPRPGERIALIGENGQGKTTVVKLITRLYDPTEGQILLDGMDLRDYDLEDLHHGNRRDFSGLHALRDDRARKHRRWPRRASTLRGRDRGRRPEEPRRERHRKTARAATTRCWAAASRAESIFPAANGRKIALARAYLRDAQLLILDEPTAALDAKSELEVFQRFAELTEGKMALLISHRFSTVRMADRIVVLEGGQLVEEGTHQQLIALGGRYAAMFEMQAASYR